MQTSVSHAMVDAAQFRLLRRRKRFAIGTIAEKPGVSFMRTGQVVQQKRQEDKD